jgi:hypothetical protein
MRAAPVRSNWSIVHRGDQFECGAGFGKARLLLHLLEDHTKTILPQRIGRDQDALGLAIEYQRVRVMPRRGRLAVRDDGAAGIRLLTDGVAAAMVGMQVGVDQAIELPPLQLMLHQCQGLRRMGDLAAID